MLVHGKCNIGRRGVEFLRSRGHVRGNGRQRKLSVSVQFRKHQRHRRPRRTNSRIDFLRTTVRRLTEDHDDGAYGLIAWLTTKRNIRITRDKSSLPPNSLNTEKRVFDRCTLTLTGLFKFHIPNEEISRDSVRLTTLIRNIQSEQLRVIFCEVQVLSSLHIEL